jgi:hypothetical protein
MSGGGLTHAERAIRIEAKRRRRELMLLGIL